MSGPYAPTAPESPAPPAEAESFRVPEGTADATAEAARTAADVKVESDAVEAIERDANPPEYPTGAPALKHFMRLPFRQRGKFMEAMEPMQSLIDRMPKKGSTVGPKEASTMYNAMAEIDELLGQVAENPDDYRRWVENASDAEFMRLFSAYFARTQMGEAASSSS